MISILRLLTRNPDNLIDSSKESFQYEIFKVHSRTVLSVPLCSAKSPLRKVLGGHLLSRSVSRQVSSADCGLTVVFGMGTGVSHSRNTTKMSRSNQEARGIRKKIAETDVSAGLLLEDR